MKSYFSHQTFNTWKLVFTWFHTLKKCFFFLKIYLCSVSQMKEKKIARIFTVSQLHTKTKNLLKFLFCSLFTLKNKKCLWKKKSEKIIFCLFHRWNRYIFSSWIVFHWIHICFEIPSLVPPGFRTNQKVSTYFLKSFLCVRSNCWYLKLTVYLNV